MTNCQSNLYWTRFIHSPNLLIKKWQQKLNNCHLQLLLSPSFFLLFIFPRSTTITYLMFFFFHHNHHQHISVVLSRPPPPYFYCFPSTTTTTIPFIQFILLLLIINIIIIRIIFIVFSKKIVISQKLISESEVNLSRKPLRILKEVAWVFVCFVLLYIYIIIQLSPCSPTGFRKLRFSIVSMLTWD